MKIACLITALVLGAAAQVPVAPAAAETAPQQHPAPQQQPAPEQHTAPNFDLDTPIARIAADARGLAVLERRLPSLVASPHFAMAAEQSLRQLSRNPHARGLTPEALTLLETELKAIR